MKSTLVGYVTRDHHSKVVLKESRRIIDCAILMVECLTVRQTIFKTSQKGILGCKLYQPEDFCTKGYCKFSLKYQLFIFTFLGQYNIIL